MDNECSEIKNKFEKKFNDWEIKITSLDIESMTINIKQINSYNIYRADFMLKELQNFKLINSKNSIKEIIDFISELIENKNIKIEENEKILKLILTLENINDVFILNKKEKLSEDMIEVLINQIEFLKKQNEKFEEKIQLLDKKNKELEEKIVIIENEKNIKNKSIMSISINEEIIPKTNEEKINEIENKLNKLDLFKYSNKIQLTHSNLKKINSIYPHYSAIKEIAVFPSGNIISVSNDKYINIYDKNLTIIQTISNAHNDYINDVYVKDENNFVTCSSDKTIKTWIKKYSKGYVYTANIFTLNQKIENAHNDRITKVIFCLNGNLISCSWDKTIKIWEEDKENIFKCKKILKHSKWISSLLLLEDKNLLISSGKDGTKFWNLNDYTCINHIQETFCEISNSLKRLNEDKIIIGGNNDGIIKVISIKDKRIIKEIKNEFKCLGICVVENKGIFLIGGESNDIKVYRSDNFNCIQILKDAHKDFINGLTQLKDCSIASYGADKSIKIWSF